MCGIGGILRTDGQPIPDEWLDAIDARIAYRGPDGAGRFRDRVTFTDEQGQQRVAEVAFVHRRLSIIDHKDGAQPMVSEHGRDESEGLVAVVFNGCIYNHRELRRGLEAKGHRFVTDHSDTEVLIHGWREWGEELFEQIEGMYALAIWDHVRKTLIYARDAFGEKPLYSLHRIAGSALADGNLLVFASSFDSIGRIRGEFATEAIAHEEWLLEYLKLAYVPRQPENARRPSDEEPRTYTIFEPQAGLPCVFRSGLHFAIEHQSRLDPASLIKQAVNRRLEADVPIGCFLSGGVDSSLIAYFAKQHKPDLMTFTVRMPDARYDESAYAEAVAAHLGTDHHTLEVAMNPTEDLVRLIGLLGQPFGDSSILPTYWVSKAARQHVKVALAGDGGDELFIGYERYLAARRLQRHWRWLRSLPDAALHRAHPKSRFNKAGRLIEMARDYPTFGVVAMESVFRVDEIEELTGLPVCGEPVECGRDALLALRDFDLLHYLPNDLLRKTDTASMACGLEVRCPFLDRDLASAVLAMPVDDLIPNGERKGLLRKIARKYLPKECVDRPKMGFAIPIGEWFRNDFGGMKTLLLDHLNSAEPFGPIQLNQKAVQRFIDAHMSGKRDHGQRLFTLLTLSIWARKTD